MSSKKKNPTGDAISSIGPTAVKSSSSLATHARAREARVLACMTRMRAGEWVKGKTGAELAADWGCSPATVDAIAGEAWRRVQAEVLDKPALQVFAVEKLRVIVDKSLASAEESDKPGLERRVAVSALESLLRYADSGSLPADWSALSPEEKWSRIDEAQARIDAVKATLPARAKEMTA